MDDNEEFDSTKHHAKRKAKIQTENRQNEAAAKETAEDKEIANFDGIIKEGETREQLLDRIRAMREHTPKKVEAEIPRSAGLQKAFEAEQEAGRAAVAKAVAELEINRAAQQKAEEGKKNQLGEMVAIYHPNPSQDQEYPAIGATLGKKGMKTGYL